MTEFQKVYACAKRPIDIWTNYLYYTISIRLVYLIRNTRISPNGLTLTALVLAVAGSILFGVGSRPFVITGLILAQVSYVFDCADGQLARYRRQFSPIGGWLDQVSDRTKEFAVYFGLAYGYTRQHPGNTRIWILAMIALFSLYLLEYYGQIGKQYFQSSQPAKPSEASTKHGREAENPGSRTAESQVAELHASGSADEASDTFRKLQFWRSFVPFRGFIIGEQYFAMLVFIAFGAVVPFFAFTAVLGVAMVVYRPAILFYKLRRNLL